MTLGRLLLTPLLLLLVARDVGAYLDVCQEMNGSRMRTMIFVQYDTVFCVIVEEGYSNWSQLDQIFISGVNNVSLKQIANSDGHCVVRAPGEPQWRIVMDPNFNIDCDQAFSLIETGLMPSFILPEKEAREYTVQGRKGLVVPQTGMWIRKKSCTGDGMVTVFTGIGESTGDYVYPYRSWTCDALPDWIFSFDTGFTIEADPLVSYTMTCSSDLSSTFVVAPGDTIAVLSGGGCDDLQNLEGTDNRVMIQIGNWETNDVIVNMDLTFDAKNFGSVILQESLGGAEMNFYNGKTTENFTTNYFEVRYAPTGLKASEIWKNQDKIIVEISIGNQPAPSTPTPIAEADPFCGCALDSKFGMPDGWDSTQIWLDVVIILDTSEAMGDVGLVDATSLIESFIGSDDGDVLITDPQANFYTRVGLIAMSDKAEVIYSLNMTKADPVKGKVQIQKGLEQIDVIAAFNAALSMFADGLKSGPNRAYTRQVIYYMTDSDPIFDPRPLDGFKTSQGKIIVNDFLEPGDLPRSGLEQLASDGYYFSDIQYNYMATIQLLCKANCYCRPDKDRTAYAGLSRDPAVPASGGCFRAVPVGVPFTKMRDNCEGGRIVSIHNQDKADFVNKQLAAASSSSDYFWIGYTKTDAGWQWEDNSTNPYTNWDVANGEPSSNSIAKCAYLDTTTTSLFWGAGNCNVGFPSACEYAPCAVGNSNC